MAHAPLLLLVNYRPEYTHHWGSKTYYTQLRLDPLGQRSADEMLSILLGEGPELAPLRRLIIEKTQGNPLFMEETVQALVEDGSLERNGTARLVRSIEQLKIPPTVQGILAARIDNLPPEEKELLQTLAVIGNEFQLSLAREVTGKTGDELNRMLADLQLREFLYEQPAMGDVEYTFKHALTHDEAYKSLLTDRRKLLHESTGHAIETLYSEELYDHLSELAHHFDLSGNVRKAAEYLSRAGYKAAEQAAHAEEIGYFTRALESLRRLPEGDIRDHQELDMHIALSWSAFVALGLRAPERECALIRARELCEQLGESAKLMRVLIALAHLRFNQAAFGTAQELGERVLAMGQGANAPKMRAGANFVLGEVAFAAGQFPVAREHLERAIKFSGASLLPEHDFLVGQVALNVLGGILTILGYPVAARHKGYELLSTARRSSDPHSVAWALLAYGLHHAILRDPNTVGDRADEVLSIAADHQLPLISIVGTFFRGWGTVAAGRSEEGILEMRRSLSDPMVSRATATSLLLLVLAETCGKNGRAEEGLELVSKALTRAEQISQRVTEAELYRIRGDLLIIKNPGDVAYAERCLRTAIDISRRQDAKLFELRATTSLARLLAKQGRRDEVHAMLADIYGWFTEGFETADLKDAKALLDELGTNS
jgi:tetratricopeptide (TPR) repeat protein